MTTQTGARSVFRFDAVGTRWEIETREPLDAGTIGQVLERIEVFDAIYSRFRPDSLVSRIAGSRRGGQFDFPADALALFDLYDDLAAHTDGAVDPLVGRDLELLGYDAAYTLAPATDEVDAAEPRRGRARWAVDVTRHGSTVLTRRPVVIDVGAVGKGYLVDLVSALLSEAGIDDHVVDAGGDLRHTGLRPIRVGLEHPFLPRRVIGVANLRDRALCASAVNRRAWGSGLHHVLDARTGLPTHGVIATWVVAHTAALADGLATALFLIGPGPLADRFEFAFVRMLADGRVQASPDFDGELFT